MKKIFKPDRNFKPFPTEEGDELFPNGIFVFNISRMLEYIGDNPGLFTPESVSVEEVYSPHHQINEAHLDNADLSVPVILAEIAPDRYNLIDGHHRVEKAFHQNIERIKAFRLKSQQHIQFLESKEAYEKYVDYWNGKIKEMQKLKIGRDIS